MRRAPVFADPKTDFVFQRIFGSEDHKAALIGFLNDILQLDGEHRITSVMLLPPEQRPKVQELKHSIVDAKCVDARGTTYVVEMQVLNVEAFEKRVVRNVEDWVRSATDSAPLRPPPSGPGPPSGGRYNVAKAYTNQLGVSMTYPELDDVIGITICDFELWPRSKGSHVPMLSRWRMQEQTSGAIGLSQLQLVFLELPKYAAGDAPETVVDKWAYFFREAGNLMAIPDALRHPPLLDALEGARTARFTRDEWDAYIAAGIALQNERGALSIAQKEGRAEGVAQSLLTVLQARGLAISDEARSRILAQTDPETLQRWLAKAVTAASAAEVFDR